MMTRRSRGEPAPAVELGAGHHGDRRQAEEPGRLDARQSSSPVGAFRRRAHAHVDGIVVVAAAGRRHSDLVACRAFHRGGLYHSGSMVPAVVVGMLMVVMVAMAAEVDVRAAPMIGSWAVGRVVHMRHRRRSNHEMRDKQEQDRSA